MNVRDFISEYHFIYKNCIDSQTRRIISIDKLNEVITYLGKKYTLFDKRQFRMYLAACSDGSINGISENTNIMELSFLKYDDVSFFNKTFISTYFQNDDLKRVNNERQTLISDLDLIDFLLENTQEKIQKLEKKVFNNDKQLNFNSRLNPKQLEALCNFLIPKFISSEYESVLASIFSDNNVKIEQSIKWKKTNRLLTYLFEQLISASFIDNSEYPNVIEKLNLFTTKSGKLIKAGDLYTAKSVYLSEKNPIGYEDIDKLIKDLTKLKH